MSKTAGFSGSRQCIVNTTGSCSLHVSVTYKTVDEAIRFHVDKSMQVVVLFNKKLQFSDRLKCIRLHR